MSTHIGAHPGDIAETVLIAGDPLRAKNFAERSLENIHCYTEVRGMYGFTGTFQGKRISIQGTGMGIPSTAIYLHELITAFGAKTIMRVGTCGSIQNGMAIGDLVIAMSACTDSSVNRLHFDGMDYAPTADFHLLMDAYAKAKSLNLRTHVGSIFSSDTFYRTDPDHWKLWADHGVLGIEMETTALYTIAARHKIRALTLLQVSDSLVTHEYTTAKERETMFSDMLRVALEIAP